jgi:GAF domain-containing protein
VPASCAGDVLDEVAPAIRRMRPSSVWLLVRDESGEALEPAAAAGNDVIASELRVPLDTVASGEPDFLPTRAAVRDRLGPVPDAESMALLPLGAGDDCLGLLGVSFADERKLSPDDRDYLAAIAGLSGLALTRTSR